MLGWGSFCIRVTCEEESWLEVELALGLAEAGQRGQDVLWLSGEPAFHSCHCLWAGGRVEACLDGFYCAPGRSLGRSVG